MATNEEDELTLLATDKEFKRVFSKAMSELAKNKEIEYKYKTHISRVVPLLRSFIFVSKRIYDEARADTARQIFEEIESTGILLMGRGYTESERKFEALKKKYKVD